MNDVAQPLSAEEEAEMRRVYVPANLVTGLDHDIARLIATLDAEREFRRECERQLQDWIARYTALDAARSVPDNAAREAAERVKASALANGGRLTPAAILDIQAVIDGIAAPASPAGLDVAREGLAALASPEEASPE